MQVKYSLPDGRDLFYSPESLRFWVGPEPDFPEPEFRSTDFHTLRLEITHQCNGNCSYCIVFGNHVQSYIRPHIQELWTWVEAQTWYSQVTDMFVIGGEPLLVYSDLVYIMERFEGRISLSTNGTLLTDEMAEVFRSRGVLVYLSMDGSTRLDNTRRRYPDGTEMYDHIQRGLERLEQAGTRKGLFMVATPATVGKIAEILTELSSSWSLERIGYSLPHWNENEPDLVSPEQYRDALLELYHRRRGISAEIIQLTWRTGVLAGGVAKRFSCGVHTTQKTVLPDRRLVRCGKIDSHPVFSGVTNFDLDQGCPVSIAINQTSECASCVALGCCGGGCPYDGLQRFGTVIDRRECVITPPLITAAVADIVAGLGVLSNLADGLVPRETVKAILS